MSWQGEISVFCSLWQHDEYFAAWPCRRTKECVFRIVADAVFSKTVLLESRKTCLMSNSKTQGVCELDQYAQ